MYEIKTLWDYTDTPLHISVKAEPLNYKITANTTIDEWKKKWDSVYKTNNRTIIYPFLQKTVDYLKNKEIKILSNHNIELYDREIKFKGIRKSTSYIGITHWKHKNDYTTEITLARSIIFPNNSQTILETIAHEVLHSILSLKIKNKHGPVFQKCVDILNKRLGIHIEYKTLDHNFRREPFNYTVYCPECGKIIKGFMRWCPELERLTRSKHLCNGIKRPKLAVKCILPNKQILTVNFRKPDTKNIERVGG